MSLKQILAAATLAVTLTACGTQATMPAASNASAIAAQAKTSPFSKLTDLEVKMGAPSDGYKKTKKHLVAKTAKRGTLWVLDYGDSIEVLHNTQTVSDEKKLYEIYKALRPAAMELKNPEDYQYVYILADRVLELIPGVR